MSRRSNSDAKALRGGVVSRLWGCLILVLALLSMPTGMQARTPGNPYADFTEERFLDMEFEPNIATPEVPRKAEKEVRAYMTRVAERMSKSYNVDMMRNDEVFVVVLPTDQMFLPNDTLLMPQAQGLLKPVMELMRDPYMYKVVMAVHTDDTGSEYYRRRLSTARLNSIYDVIIDAIDNGTLSEDLIVVPFALGSDMPLQPNDTRRHRAENRRVEFYFIPGPEMIEKALKREL